MSKNKAISIIEGRIGVEQQKADIAEDAWADLVEYDNPQRERNEMSRKMDDHLLIVRVLKELLVEIEEN